MGKRSYYTELAAEMKRANEAAIKGGKTREQLVSEIEEITSTLAGPLDNAARIGLAADRRQLQRELAALAGK